MNLSALSSVVAPERPTAYSAVDPAPVPIERHYSSGEIAELWNLNVETIRRLFENEPGVIVLQAPLKKGKRPYRTIRIPQSVLDRVHRRLQVGGEVS